MTPIRILSSLCSLAFATGFPVLSLADGLHGCPVTKAPDSVFVPPAPYRGDVGSGQFLYGTPDLWTVIHNRWRVHGGSKLPYFRQGFDAKKEPDPQLSVVARPLDGPDPIVWAGWANSASIDETPQGMFMVTGLSIPTAGCWEISAHYTVSREKIHTLTYTVWVEP